MPGYSLAQAPDPIAERERLALVQRYLDERSIAVLERLDISRAWRCLDVGAGAGSIARWLAERVGPDGSVLALDLEVDLLEPLASPTLSVRRADVRSDELPEDLDLIHARLVLEHMPEHDEVFERLVRALRPGGWLVVTDGDYRAIGTSEPEPAFDRAKTALFSVAREVGWNMQLGPALVPMFETAGLVDVSADVRCGYERAGAWGMVLTGTYRRLRERLVQHGLDAADLDRIETRVRDATLGLYSAPFWTVSGRKPR